MTFSILTLRNYLWQQFRIIPELVHLETLLRDDLHLTDGDVQVLIRHLSLGVEIQLPENAVQHLTDVFDLVVYVMLRSREESSRIPYGDDPDFPSDEAISRDYLLLTERMDQRSNLN